jgi:tripartite ATP-independent transporter DctP family solute receptor
LISQQAVWVNIGMSANDLGGRIMEMLKRAMVLLFVLAMAVSITACGDKEEAADTGGTTDMGTSVVFHMGGGLTQKSPQYKALEDFKQEVYEKSEGTIDIQLDLSGALGTDREIIEGVMNGSIAMMHMADISIGTVITELGYVNLPYLFPTREDAETYYLYGWIGEAYKKTMAENGMRALGQLLEGDFRWMTNSKHSIQTPDDLKNLKIRVVESPMYIEFFKKIGTNPIGMSVSEVAPALQQGVIDGQDNGPLNTYFYGFYDFQKYLTKTNHAYAANMWVINEDTFQSLSEAQQKVLTECADKYTALAYEYQLEAIDGFCDEMAEAGTELLDSTPELDAFLKVAAVEVWKDESITGPYDQEVMQQILRDFAVN